MKPGKNELIQWIYSVIADIFVKVFVYLSRFFPKIK